MANGLHFLLGVGLLLVAGGCATQRAPLPPDLRAWGISYRLQTFSKPRPIRAHILRVDLAAGKVVPGVVVAPDPDGDGPAEAALTPPLALVKDRPVLAFVNANSWDGLPDSAGKRDRYWREGQFVDIAGIAVSNGIVRSAIDKSNVSVRFPAAGPPVIEEKDASSHAVEAVAGFQQLVRAGVVLPKPGGALAPRTAMGLDKKGATLWVVVVDGRQEGFSEGMAFDELARLMKDLGCHDAANLDGGGSSLMGMRNAGGAMQIVSSPSDRFLGDVRIRPVPLVFTLIPAH